MLATIGPVSKAIGRERSVRQFGPYFALSDLKQGGDSASEHAHNHYTNYRVADQRCKPEDSILWTDVDADRRGCHVASVISNSCCYEKCSGRRGSARESCRVC